MISWLGWAGWATAVAMLFIWDPEAAAMHRVGGVALLLWLLAVAGLLTWKGTSCFGYYQSKTHNGRC